MGLCDRFTDPARRVMKRANDIAQEWNQEFIGTEAVLLGLFTAPPEERSNAERLFLRFGLTEERVRTEVGKAMQKGPDTVVMGSLPQTPRAVDAIKYANEEGQQSFLQQVDTQELLLGLLRSTEGVAFAVLTSLGLAYQAVREAINEGCHLIFPPPQETEPNVFRFDLASYQIGSGIDVMDRFWKDVRRFCEERKPISVTLRVAEKKA